VYNIILLLCSWHFSRCANLQCVSRVWRYYVVFKKCMIIFYFRSCTERDECEASSVVFTTPLLNILKLSRSLGREVVEFSRGPRLPCWYIIGTRNHVCHNISIRRTRTYWCLHNISEFDNGMVILNNINYILISG